MEIDAEKLDAIYRKYNRRKFVHPDPLEFLYRYPDIRDREIAGLVASSVAVGRVAQILGSVSNALDRLGSSPRKSIENATAQSLKRDFAGFRHRFIGERDLIAMLVQVKRAIEEYGSIEGLFKTGFAGNEGDFAVAIARFSDFLNGHSKPGTRCVPRASKGSACKRLMLYLRWVVRKDAVDPGGWRGIPTACLIVPLDTHMHNIGLKLGLTSRTQADMKTAQEITKGFRRFCPKDPVKYDFALTRFGIRNDLDIEELTDK